MSHTKRQVKERLAKARARGWAKRSEAMAKIVARVEAEREPHSITLSHFLELPAQERKKIRLIGGRKISAPLAKKERAAKKEDEIRCALKKFLKEDTQNKNLPAKTIADRLRSDRKSHFGDGVPYLSAQTFLRKVRLCLAEIRPRQRRKR